MAFPLPTPLLLTSIGLLAVDIALRPWRPWKQHGWASAAYLTLAWAPLFALPFMPPWMVALAIGLIALACHASFSRLVGLTDAPRFFWSSLLCTAAFFVVARLHWYGLFQAMPAFAIAVVLGAAALRDDATAFLQKLCLAWVGMLVFGYLGAHGALFADLQTHTLEYGGGTWISFCILGCKFADLAWVVAQRLGGRSVPVQLLSWVGGGTLGGALLAAETPATLGQLALMGGLQGLTLGLAGRAFDLIVRDVAGELPDRPLKGTMLFGFSFALAVAYHFVRYVWS